MNSSAQVNTQYLDRTIVLASNGHTGKVGRVRLPGLGKLSAARTTLIFCEGFRSVLDIAAASLLLIILSPLILLVAATIKFSSNGPVIFRQQRLTKGGQAFTLLKFRSMVMDAESKTGPIWCMGENDSRITRVGKFIRATRLDELPQLLNVITGDMSIVGPRPERPEFAAKLSQALPNFSDRLKVKAGITGLAQVRVGYAGCMATYRRKLQYDLQYIEQKSFLLDLKILFATVFVVFGRSERASVPSAPITQPGEVVALPLH